MSTHAKCVSIETVIRDSIVYYVRDNENHPVAVVALYKQKNGIVSRGIAIKSIVEKKPDKFHATMLAIYRLYDAIYSKKNVFPMRSALSDDKCIGFKSVERFYIYTQIKYKTLDMDFKGQYNVNVTNFEKELLKDI